MENTTIALLPGTGLDAAFVEDAFGDAARSAGWWLDAVEPDPRDVIGSYTAALDEARATVRGPLVVGGVSLGAAVAARWVSENPGVAAGLLIAMPAWTGAPSGSPASAAASTTAAALRATGIDATIEAMTASSPPWLSALLARAWRGQWPDLARAMDDAAAYTGPTVDMLEGLHLPVGVVAAVDDPVHPLAVGRRWCRAIPHARLETFELDVLRTSTGELGRLGLRALSAAGRPR